MVLEPICCPSCNSTNIVKNGKSEEGKQRYRCRNHQCSRRSFIREYTYRGYLPEVKQQISDMAVNGSGIRDTARVLKISPTTVIEELKKRLPSRTSQHRSTPTDGKFTHECDGG
ncbi:IS1-like element transposase [Phormidesmis sp. 146-33]